MMTYIVAIKQCLPIRVRLSVAIVMQSSLHEVITGSIARSATRLYLIYSEADFEVFRPAGATRCTDGDEVGRGGGDPRSPPPRPTSSPSVQR